MHRRVHSRLHRIEIMNLVHQFCIVVRNHERIHGSKNNRNIRARCMYDTLAKIKKSGKPIWSDIQSSSALLHLLVAALYCICSCLRNIVEWIRIKEAITACLTICEQNTNTLLMVTANGVLEHLTTQIARDTCWIAQTYPGNTWKRTGDSGISLDTEHHSRAQSSRWWGRLWLLRWSADLNLTCCQQ